MLSHSRPFWPKKKKKLSRVNCDNFLVYDGKKLVLDPWGRPKGAEGGHAYCVIFAFQKISTLQGWYRTLSVELFCTEENGIVDDLCSQPDPVVQSSLRGHNDVKKDGDGAAGERPAKCART